MCEQLNSTNEQAALVDLPDESAIVNTAAPHEEFLDEELDYKLKKLRRRNASRYPRLIDTCIVIVILCFTVLLYARVAYRVAEPTIQDYEQLAKD